MAAKNLLVDDRRHGKAIEAVRECFPKFDIVPSLACKRQIRTRMMLWNEMNFFSSLQPALGTRIMHQFVFINTQSRGSLYDLNDRVNFDLVSKSYCNDEMNGKLSWVMCKDKKKRLTGIESTDPHR